MNPIIIAALYKFAPLSDIAAMREAILYTCKKHNIYGILLLAHEGINGTIAGERGDIDALLNFLRSYPPLFTLGHKESSARTLPFYRMKVRLKKEIVTMGISEANPNKMVGTYLTPEAWNQIIAEPDTILVDTRNDYEVKIGTFKGAIDPRTRTFREFPDYVKNHFDNQKHKKVAMFCTGGIRCEKASAYMRMLGFEQVYHLKGGILKYLEEMPEEKSLWRGECFVFDQRVSVKHGLKLGSYELCPSCRHPIHAEDKKGAKYIEGVACLHCHDTLSEEKKSAAAERHRQIKLAEARGKKHLGAQFMNEEEI
ncbi:MAG: rhodanese-related sulfurtransferase [Proteobacteria bacterium]|nr:rhodanese-related sulfurtransferase [Pseudomonadota bacterium]